MCSQAQQAPLEDLSGENATMQCLSGGNHTRATPRVSLMHWSPKLSKGSMSKKSDTSTAICEGALTQMGAGGAPEKRPLLS